MLSSVLRSLAIRTNIEIMRAFVVLRRVLESRGDLATGLTSSSRMRLKFASVFKAIRTLMAPPR